MAPLQIDTHHLHSSKQWAAALAPFEQSESLLKRARCYGVVWLFLRLAGRLSFFFFFALDLVLTWRGSWFVVRDSWFVIHDFDFDQL